MADTDIAPGGGTEGAVIFDIFEHQYVLMLGLNCRHGHAGAGDATQHRRFDRDRRSAFGNASASIRPAHQQHLRKIASRQPLQPGFLHPGQGGDTLRERGHADGTAVAGR